MEPDTRHATRDTRHPTPDTRHPTPDTRHATPDTRHGALLFAAVFLAIFGRFGHAGLALALGVAIFRFGWTVVGAIGVLTGFIILAYYSVVAGWTLGYIVRSLTGGINATSVETATTSFVSFAGNWGWGIGCHFVFMVLPTVFHQIPGGLGVLWTFLFFLLLSVAALTSGVSLLEVVTSYFVDEKGVDRRKATMALGAAIFILGVPCALSSDGDITGWARMEWLRGALVWAFGDSQGSFLQTLDTLSFNWCLPLGGLFTCVFVGWVWGTRSAVMEIRHGSENFADVHLVALLSGLKDDESHNSPDHVWTLASVWGIFIRFFSPLAVLIAFLYKVGWLKL